MAVLLNTHQNALTSRLRYQRAGLSAAAGAFERVTTAVTSIARVRILVEAVGAGGYGTWLAILGFAQAGRMLNGGTHYALVNRFAEASLDASGHATRRVLSTAFYLYLAIAVMGASIGCGLLSVVPLNRWLGQSDTGSEASRLLAMCIVWVFAAMPANLFGTLLVGTQRRYVLSIWGACTTAIQVIILWAAVQYGWHSITLLGLVIVTTDLISSCGLAIYVALRTGFVPSLRHFDGASVPRLFTEGSCFMAADVGNWLKLSLPSLLIAGIAGPVRLAEFAIILQLCQTCVGFIALIGTSLWPAYAQSASAGDDRWLAEAFSRASAVSILLAGWSAALLLVFGDFILRIWLQGRIAWSPRLALLLATWVVGQSFVVGAWTFLAGVSRTKSMAGITVAEGAAASLGSFVLIQWFGASGAAAAMAISVFGSALVLMVAARAVVPRMSFRLLTRSAVVAVGTLFAISVLKLAWSNDTTTSGEGATSAVAGSLLTVLYASLTWYVVATADHRRRARLMMKSVARVLVKRGSTEEFAGGQ